MAQIEINSGTSANDKTGTNWMVAWQSVQIMFTEIYGKLFESGKVLSDNNYTDAEASKLDGIEAGAQVNVANTVIDASYVHTDNNYDENEVLALAFVKDTPISYTAAIPFTKALTDIATHTMVANITLTVETTGAVDNACTQLLLINNTSYTATVTAFHLIGEQDNTKAYSLLTFERKRGLYLVSIVNFD